MATFSAALLNQHGRDEFVEIAEAVDRGLGYENLFVSDERFYRNPYALLALAAEHTDRVGLATGVTNPYTRNPAFTAAAIASVDELSGRRAFLGFGAGSPMVLDPLGIAQDHPIGAVRDAVGVIRDLLDGASVSADRPEFELHDVALDFEPGRRVPVYVAGRGPQILALGGEIGDGAIAGAGLTSVRGMEYARSRVAAGAERADRDPDDVDLVCWAFLSMADDQAVALDAVTPLVARIVAAVPLDTLAAIGVPRADAERIKDRSSPHELPAAELRDVVSRAVVEQFSIAGTPDQCRDHVERLLEAGVRHVAVLAFENAENDALGNLTTFSTEVVDEVTE